MVDDFDDCDSIESISLSEIDGDHLDYEADLGTSFSLEYQFYEWLENLDNHEDTDYEFSAELYDWDFDFIEDTDVELNGIEFSEELYDWKLDDFEETKEDWDVKMCPILLKAVQMRPFLRSLEKLRSYSGNIRPSLHQMDGRRILLQTCGKSMPFDPGII